MEACKHTIVNSWERVRVRAFILCSVVRVRVRVRVSLEFNLNPHPSGSMQTSNCK